MGDDDTHRRGRRRSRGRAVRGTGPGDGGEPGGVGGGTRRADTRRRVVRYDDSLDALVVPVRREDPSVRWATEVRRHLEERTCPVCGGRLPCRRHGELSEDRGQWLWKPSSRP